MSDHHHHHDHSGPIAIGATAARVVVGLLSVIGVIVVIATIMLWPSDRQVEIPLPMQNADGSAVETEAGTVFRQDVGPCGSLSSGKVFEGEPESPSTEAYTCQRSLISIESGPNEGSNTLLEVGPGPGQPDLSAGDELRIVRQTGPDGMAMYSFDDYARGLPLTWLAIAFVLVIIVVARWRGLRALLGLGFAFLVLVMFLLPALLDGKPAIPVALVAGSLILYAVLYLAHGLNLRTSSALLGTLTSMIIAAALSWIVIDATRITGLSEEQNTNVATYLENVSITGLLLAGFIIGSLGVLNDVTITQASAAFELAELDKKASRREIFTAAMRVGRDHIASTVYTLVLAYAGGSLPLLLLFSVANRPIRDVLVGDAVAIEIARSAVGGICLTLSVPLTTAIAVMLARPFGSKKGAQRKPAPTGRGGATTAAAGGGGVAGTRGRAPEHRRRSGRRGSGFEGGDSGAGVAPQQVRGRGEWPVRPGSQPDQYGPNDPESSGWPADSRAQPRGGSTAGGAPEHRSSSGGVPGAWPDQNVRPGDGPDQNAWPRTGQGDPDDFGTHGRQRPWYPGP